MNIVIGCICYVGKSVFWQKGFFFIEFMVVVVIIGILGMIVLLQYQWFLVKVKLVVVFVEVVGGKVGVELFFVEGSEIILLVLIGLFELSFCCIWIMVRSDVMNGVMSINCEFKSDVVIGSGSLILDCDLQGVWFCKGDILDWSFFFQVCLN